jgi:putative ABC transport system ATP-binding protein
LKGASALNDVIGLRGVEKYYSKASEKIQILNAISLSINEGEFVAITGPSGSGKSTLLNLLAGLDRPDAGSIQVAGKRIDTLSNAELSEWRSRNIGFVFQFYNLFPTLNAERNVEIPLLLTNLDSRQRRHRVDIALALVGLSDRKKHRPAELSGGQLQRVAIARAIVSDPKILICDEPTGDLDRKSAIEVLTLLTALKERQNKTIIMVTHDAKAAEYAERTITLDKGSLIDTMVEHAQ